MPYNHMAMLLTNLYALTSVCIRSFWSSGSSFAWVTCFIIYLGLTWIWSCVIRNSELRNMEVQRQNYSAGFFCELCTLFLLYASICRVLPPFCICIESQISINCYLQAYIEPCPVGAPETSWDLLVNQVHSWVRAKYFNFDRAVNHSNRTVLFGCCLHHFFLMH